MSENKCFVFESECGCCVTCSGPYEQADGLDFCPLHAAAPEMLSWIKCCTAAFDYEKWRSPLMMRGWNVIDKAEGRNHE